MLQKLCLGIICLLSCTLDANEKTKTVPIPEKDPTYQVWLEVSLHCPLSTELENFRKSIPAAPGEAVSWEEWKCSFLNSMHKLIQLVENDQAFNTVWSAKVEEKH